MSKQTKKPAELAARKVKNVNLLPQVFVTEPNKKMLDSSLDLMTSKGQLSNFKETLGLRSATNGIDEFFRVESDPVRRESQSNNMLVMRDTEDSYLGKASYLDLENYFRVKGLELKDGVQLDKDINILDLPIIPARLSDYHLYYWVANDLPPMPFYFAEAAGGGNKFSITQDLLGKPDVTLVDDETGKSIKLLTGMVVYFTGFVDPAYRTFNEVAAGNFVPGKVYTVSKMGTTDFVAIGAAPAAEFYASITGNILTVTEKTRTNLDGTITTIPYQGQVLEAGSYITGPGITPGTFIVATNTEDNSFTGRGKLGTYKVNIAQSVAPNDVKMQPSAGTSFTASDRGSGTGVAIDEEIKTYFVVGAGESLSLLRTTNIDKRIPNSYLKKRPWDKSDPLVDAPAIRWDSEVWDGSQIVTSEPEYITMDKYIANENHWGVVDHWYRISLIKNVAEFLEVSVSDIVSEENKAKRPIITFGRHTKLYNWPNNVKTNVTTMLTGIPNNYANKFAIKDLYGYTVTNGDRVVFEQNREVFTVTYESTGAVFTPVDLTIDSGDGVIVIANSKIRYYRLLYKNNKWQFAQNKTTKNQCPKFEFYTSAGINLEEFNEIDYRGATILDFAPGPVYDYVLDRRVQVSSIDFDIINENNSLNISPNQLKFVTDVDKTFSYNEPLTGEEIKIKGPHGYKYLGPIPRSFYQPRRGLDITKQTQDLFFDDNTETQWSGRIEPTAQGFDTIHIFYDQNEKLKFYFNIQGHGLIRFSGKRGFQVDESVIPLVSGSTFKIVCHDLPYGITFYRTEVIDNISRPVLLEAPYCVNNGTANGVIELDLSASILQDDMFVDNILNIDTTRLFWTANNVTKSAIVRPAEKWRFIQFAYLRDKTNPIYESFDYTVSDITEADGSLSYYQQLISTPLLDQKSKYGDKVCLDTLVIAPENRTAPLSLTTNPLNAELDVINYYALYQHTKNLVSNTSNPKESLQTDPSLIIAGLGGGTLLKHNSPIAKAAVVATNLPYDFSEIIIKQGKHYDSFLNKLTYELGQVIDKNDTSNMSSLAVLNLAVSNIFLNQSDNENFWYHSNMLGWGNSINYTEVVKAASDYLTIPLNMGLSPISHRAGKETILHVSVDNKILTRNVDYRLVSEDGYYTAIQLNAAIAPTAAGNFKIGSQYIIKQVGNTNFVAIGAKTNTAGEFFIATGPGTGSGTADNPITIRQWTDEFNSKIPASLAKIGLSPVYQPEIYADYSYGGTKFFLCRHDGTRLHLAAGVDENNYPADTVDQLLFEYEKAVWSSIAYAVENNSNAALLEDQPGYFRPGRYSWSAARAVVNSEVLSWIAENSIFTMSNNAYNETDPFTQIYQLGTGDDDYTMTGSWRAVYKYLYDTDRPHSHPWEMLGHTIKPVWWDFYYSWTVPAKRTALEKALRTGNVGTPEQPETNPFFARVGNVGDPESFPVNEQGELLAPSELAWLDAIPIAREWIVGEQGPYETAFLNTQRGLAAEAKLKFLASPARYVNLNWVPGQVTANEWGINLDSTSAFWINGAIHHDYHRKIVNGAVTYTAGIESLYAEFCALNNKDFKSTVIDKFDNLTVNKEFLLGGFSNKNNIRIESTSIASQRKTLFVPEENYAVRLVKHYADREIFYSAMRVIWTGTGYSIHGFATELGLFNYYAPVPGSSVTAKTIGSTVVKEKNVYRTEASTLTYGQVFASRQEIYDVIVGHGKYLESQGFKFEEVESYDLRNWQLSASQFIFWSADSIAAGNYIDLNPAASGIVLSVASGQLENLEGTNDNSGQCVDRKNNPLFSKDLLVERGERLVIKTKDASNPIYGIKLTFAVYESVVHLDPISVFDDVYFLPEQCTTKRSFVIGGKKSQAWDGKYFVPGYVVSDNTIIPNYDTFSEVGRNLLDIENVVNDSTILEASRAQFGLTRNPELRQLFLQEETETLFKNAITYTKGTKQVFDGLEPLTHTDGSETTPLEEYMVRIGEFGNTKNIEFYEFELSADDMQRNPQVISFVPADADKTSPYIHYVTDISQKWVNKPRGKNLSFSTLDRSFTNLKTSGPIVKGDTDFAIASLEELPSLYSQFSELTDIAVYANNVSYKKNTLLRHEGSLYYSLTTVSPNSWVNNSDKFSRLDEPFLPNIFVANYDRPNPDLSGTGRSMYTPGTWQVLQTVDRNIAVTETCPGPSDVSKARVSCNIPHTATAGDYVLIVNANSANADVNGIWRIDSIENDRAFYINTRITEVIKTGKVFVFKPVRFKNTAELNLATGQNAGSFGYAWKKKFNPFSNAVGTTNTVLPATASGYDAANPIAIIDSAVNTVQGDTSFDFGNYQVFEITQTDTVNKTVVKTDSLPLDNSDIEHLIIYDYVSNKVMAKLELFDPRKLYLPAAFKNDIDVINRVDPARYTRTTDQYKSAYASLGWYEEFVGRRWWDTSTVQFSDYESGDALSRAQYWGTTVDNKLPDIYEWTRSPVHPTQWNQLVESQGMAFEQRASGQVYVDKSTGTDNYHWVEEQDYVNGNTYNVYYFWVKNKDTISPESRAVRIYSTGQLSKIILNPSAAGLPWWAPINSNSIMLKGVEGLLNNSSTVVQIKKKLKGNEKHQQWLFVSEANPTETIPQWIHTRLRDSLAGGIHYRVDENYTVYSAAQRYQQSDFVKHNDSFYVCRGTLGGVTGTFNPVFWQPLINVEEVDDTTFRFDITKNVPDFINLHRYARVGNVVRPHPQSWFEDMYEARRTFVKKVNQLLLHVDVSSVPNWGDILNQTAYTLFDDVYDMTQYWTFVDYQSEDYDPAKEIAVTISTISEIYSSFVTVRSYIKVLEDNTVYEKDANGGFKVVYRAADAVNQRGAIQLSDELFDPRGKWDGSKWDAINVPWDFDLCNVFYAIMEALRYDVFVDAYKNNYSKMTCAMFRYVLSEQVNVDWLQKSSTIEPANLINKNLEKSNTLRRDDIGVFTEFYSSVKSYRDKIRSATVSKQLIENASLSVDETMLIDGTEINIGIAGQTAGADIVFN